MSDAPASVSADSGAKVTRLRQPKPCPICQKTSNQSFHPFCSGRCADIDLNRWLTGAYVIPVTDEEEEANAEQDPAGFDEP